MTPTNPITEARDLADRMRKVLNYNEETGVFKRIKSSGELYESPAGYVKSLGYRHIQVLGKMYRAHRLAWLLSYDKWPDEHIDHINGMRDDNRLTNLRDVCDLVNKQNRKKTFAASGIMGVYKDKKKWCSKLVINGERVFLGTFETAEEAGEAYRIGELKYFGEIRYPNGVENGQ